MLILLNVHVEKKLTLLTYGAPAGQVTKITHGRGYFFLKKYAHFYNDTKMESLYLLEEKDNITYKLLPILEDKFTMEIVNGLVRRTPGNLEIDSIIVLYPEGKKKKDNYC